MDQSLRISQLETELTLLNIKIRNAEINLKLPSASSFTRQTLEEELAGLQKTKQKLTDEIGQLRAGNQS